MIKIANEKTNYENANRFTLYFSESPNELESQRIEKILSLISKTKQDFSIVSLLNPAKTTNNQDKYLSLEERLPKEYQYSIQKEFLAKFRYELWRKKVIDGYHEFKTPLLHDALNDRFIFGENNIENYLSKSVKNQIPYHLLRYSEKQ